MPIPIQFAPTGLLGDLRQFLLGHRAKAALALKVDSGVEAPLALSLRQQIFGGGGISPDKFAIPFWKAHAVSG